MFMKRMMEDDTLKRVQDLKAYVEGLGYTMPQFTLAWCLRQKAVSSVIIGATSVGQVEANIAASGLVLDAEIWTKAENILTGKKETE